MMSTSLWLAGFITIQVSIFDASKSWWVGVIAAGMVPESIFIVASLHSKTFWKLLRNFQTIFVSFYGIATTLALCILWRRHPLKIASALLLLPSWLAAGFLDAFPDKGRLVFSRVFFFLYLSGLLLYFLAINFVSGADLDDLMFTIQGWHFTLTSVAAVLLQACFHLV